MLVRAFSHDSELNIVVLVTRFPDQCLYRSLRRMNRSFHGSVCQIIPGKYNRAFLLLQKSCSLTIPTYSVHRNGMLPLLEKEWLQR